jgi:hypothetical protein
MANFPDGSLPVTFNPTVAATIQDRTLQRVYRDALFPNLLFRMEAMRELWPIHLGQSQTFTRSGLMEVTTLPGQAGVDPVAETYSFEQWDATAQQWKGSIDTDMPTSYLALASQYLRNIHQLGMKSGQSINRVVRDKGYNAYVAGNTVTDASASSGASTIHVANITGFTTNLFNGRQQPVSASNPINITIPGLTTTAYQVTAVTADVAGDPIHGGTLTITPTLSGNLASRSSVLTEKRSQLIYSGGGTNIDAIDASDVFAVRDIRTAIAQLRFNNVPAHEDGLYHWHLDPQSEQQVFADNEFQRLNQSMPDYVHYRRFALAIFGSGVFYRNNEAPNTQTCNPNPLKSNTHGFELTNGAGIDIRRPICTGQGWIEEKYVDESQYISAAGIMGKIGEFAVTNGGIQVVTEGVRLIMRAPIDKMQQTTSTSYSISGDWPVPTDELGPGSKATYKRAVVVCHAA